MHAQVQLQESHFETDRIKTMTQRERVKAQMREIEEVSSHFPVTLMAENHGSYKGGKNRKTGKFLNNFLHHVLDTTDTLRHAIKIILQVNLCVFPNLLLGL